MSRALARKLSNFLPLGDAEEAYLSRITTGQEHIRAHRDIIRYGELPTNMFVVEQGFAIRYRMLSSGERQILSFMLPGDICDLNVFLLRQMDHSVAALGPVQICRLSRDDLLKTYLNHPRLSASLWWSALQMEAISRERIVALGRRKARGRVAYFFFDLYWRLKSIDLAKDNQVDLPITQVELADTLGLTPVHINRVLRQLEEDNLIEKGRGQIRVLEPEALQQEADLDDFYLHLDAPPVEVARYFQKLEQEFSEKERLIPASEERKAG